MATRATLHPNLPPKPVTGFCSTSHTSHSQPSQPHCSICLEPPKYTCPGCSTRTCSLPCSSSHKSMTGCTGQRNKAAYVPMNGYTWGTMVDDYVFLEDVGRRVSEWGREIVRGGYRNVNHVDALNRGGSARGGRGRGRGRGRGERGGGRGGHSKRDTLKAQLESRDIEVDLLPVGMERRKLNQSTWDSKKQTAFLTIEYQFHKPKDPLAPSSRPIDPPFILLSHRNDIMTTLISLIRDRLHEIKSKSKAYPQWMQDLIYPDKDDPEAFTHPQCVMATRLDPITSRRLSLRSKRVYFALDPKQPLATSLAHTQFVEFPTIDVWDEFEGTIVDAQGIVQQEEERPTKRRRMNSKAGKKAIEGLLGDYGSSEEDEQEEENQNVLAGLNEYTESDGGEMTSDPANRGDGEISSDDDGEGEVDPAVLLKLLRDVRGRDTCAFEENEAVDWGDGDLDDDEPEPE